MPDPFQDEASSWRRASASASRARPVDPGLGLEPDEPAAAPPPRARSVFAPSAHEEPIEPIEPAAPPAPHRSEPVLTPEPESERMFEPQPQPEPEPEPAPEPAPAPELPLIAPRPDRRREVVAAPVPETAPVETVEPAPAPEPEPAPAPPSANLAAPREDRAVAAGETPPPAPENAAPHRSFSPSELRDVQDALADPPPAEAEAPKAKPKSRSWGLGKDGVRDIWARLQAMDDTPRSRDKQAEPAEAKPEKPATPLSDPIPWERLDIYGFLPGLGLTLRKILMKPGEFFGAMPEGRPMGKALVFNLLISEFLLVIDFLWSLFGLRGKWAASGNADMVGAVTQSPGLGFLIALLLVPPVLSIGVYLDAWFTHLLLLLFRSAKKGFTETFRVLCYSAAPTTLSAVPVAGQLLSPVILVWYMAIQAIGLTRVHKGGLTQTLAAIFIKWSVYLFLLLAVLQNVAPGQ